MNRIEEFEHFIFISLHPENKRTLGELMQQVLADEEFLPMSSYHAPADADKKTPYLSMFVPVRSALSQIFRVYILS